MKRRKLAARFHRPTWTRWVPEPITELRLLSVYLTRVNDPRSFVFVTPTS